MDSMGKNFDGAGMRIGIVQSRFNPVICKGLLAACLAELARRGVRDADITVIDVPGALEISLALQRLAKKGVFDALIALGAVIRGETYHFEVVANESARGVNEVQLHASLPIANAILTVDSDAQAEERMNTKGTEAALVAIEMANLLKKLT